MTRRSSGPEASGRSDQTVAHSEAADTRGPGGGQAQRFRGHPDGGGWSAARGSEAACAPGDHWEWSGGEAPHHQWSASTEIHRQAGPGSGQAWDAADSEVQSPARASCSSPARCACGRRPIEAGGSSPAPDQHQTRADEAGTASDPEVSGGDRGPACEAPTPAWCDPANS